MWWFFSVILWSVGIGVTLALGIILYLVYFTSTTDYWKKKGVPSVNFNEVINWKDRLLMQLPFHEYDARMYKRIREQKLAYAGWEEARGRPAFYAVDLDLIKYVMVKDFEYFVNRRRIEGQKNDEFFGEMLFIKENQEWKDLRSTMSPTFTTGKIRRMFEIFNQSGDKFVKYINQAAMESSELDLKDISGKFTMDVIASSAFGMESKVFNDKDSVFSQMAKRFQNNFNGFSGIFRLLFFIFMPKLALKLKVSLTDVKSARFFQEIIRKTMEHRRTTGEKREDFLQLMLEAQAGQLKSETGDNEHAHDQYEKDAKLSLEKTNKVKATDSVITSQCLLFFIGGFDTTETLLVFAAYEMALNPDVQEKLYQEIEDAVSENGGKLTYDLLNRMEYLEKIISETLRKWPPTIRTERMATFDYTLPNTEVVLPKGTFVAVPIWAIHHDEEYYPDPEKFDPERFSAENKSKRHPYAYMPFGVGPRNCIAMRFAIIEGKTALAKLVHNFILEPSPKTHIPMKFPRVGLLKPDGGMWLSVKPRNKTIDE